MEREMENHATSLTCLSVWSSILSEAIFRVLDMELVLRLHLQKRRTVELLYRGWKFLFSLSGLLGWGVVILSIQADGI